MKFVNEETEQGKFIGLEGVNGRVGFVVQPPKPHPKFQWVYPESSTIAGVGYSHAFHTLRIEFNGGRIYEYDNVPFSTFKDLVQAESAGSFFQKNVRNQFPTTEIEDVDV